MPYQTKNTTTGPSGNSSRMMSGGTRYFVDGISMSGSMFNLWYAGAEQNGYESISTISAGGFESSNWFRGMFNEYLRAYRILTNFSRATQQISKGNYCNFMNFESDIYSLQYNTSDDGIFTVGSWNDKNSSLFNLNGSEADFVIQLIDAYSPYITFQNSISFQHNLDNFQTALDLVGLVPFIGEIADGLNAGIYALRGDYANASLSLAAMVPFAGWAATGSKLGFKAAKGGAKAYGS